MCTTKKREWIYGSEAVDIERFTKGKKRPKSKTFQKAYPDLYDFLLKKEASVEFNVGIIHLDGNGALSKKLALSGKNPLEIALFLRKVFYWGLLDISKKIKEDPLSPLGQIDFLTATSRFVSAENVVRSFGFEIFDIDDNNKIKFKADSHKRNLQTYRILLKKKTVSKKIKERIENKPKPEKMILISKKALLAFFEEASKLSNKNIGNKTV